MSPRNGMLAAIDLLLCILIVLVISFVVSETGESKEDVFRAPVQVKPKVQVPDFPEALLKESPFVALVIKKEGVDIFDYGTVNRKKLINRKNLDVVDWLVRNENYLDVSGKDVIVYLYEDNGVALMDILGWANNSLVEVDFVDARRP